jgi:hypothetical protein
MKSLLKSALRVTFASRTPTWLLIAAVATSCGANGTSSAAPDVTSSPVVASTPAVATASPGTEAPSTGAPSPAADRPTKPQYIQMAEALCEVHNQHNHDALRQWKIDHGLDPDDLAPMELQEPMQKEVLVPDIVAEFNELRALARPVGDEAALQRWFDAFDAMAPAWKEDPVNDEHWIDVNAISQAYGINPDVC